MVIEEVCDLGYQYVCTAKCGRRGNSAGKRGMEVYVGGGGCYIGYRSGKSPDMQCTENDLKRGDTMYEETP